MKHRVVRVPKGHGAFRNIYIVSKADRKVLRGMLGYLDERLSTLDRLGVSYAFRVGRNCSLNALQHVGYRYTLSLDLESFFDSVTRDHVGAVLPPEIIDRCFIDGAPRQGLPTSPAIATIAFLPCDRDIHAALTRRSIRFVYTRYADDLVFSFDRKRDAFEAESIVERIVKAHGFMLNGRKRKLQDARHGRRIITGIGVGDEGIHPTRRTRKKLRAALHQGRERSARGLAEWSTCKLPNAAVGAPLARS